MDTKPLNVAIASKSHYNKVNCPSVEASLVENQDGSVQTGKPLYIPDSIDLDRLLDEHPPNFSYHKDYFVHILHLINAISIRNRDLLDKNDGFTPIHKKTLQSKNRNYKDYLIYLKDMGIIEENHLYKPGEYSQSYKFTDRYNTKTIPAVITKKTLVKSLSNYDKSIDVDKTEDYLFLKKWFNEKLVIDVECATNKLTDEFLEDLKNSEIKNPTLRLNSKLIPVQKLFRKEYDFFVDSSGNRLHTNLTCVKSNIRKCINYDNERLVGIDIKNAQPYLAVAVLDIKVFKSLGLEHKIKNPYTDITKLKKLIKSIENNPDVLLFKHLVSSGGFYEEFGQLLLNEKLVESKSPDVLRNEVKEIVFEAIYSSNKNNSPTSRVFKSTFPSVYKVFTELKKGRGKKAHSHLALLLQRLEADLVLNKACRLVNSFDENIPLFTIHDNIVTTVNNRKLVKRILKRVLKNSIGLKPSLKVEYW